MKVSCDFARILDSLQLGQVSVYELCLLSPKVSLFFSTQLVVDVYFMLKFRSQIGYVHRVQFLVFAEHSRKFFHLLWTGSTPSIWVGRASTKVRTCPFVALLGGVLCFKCILVWFAVDVAIDVRTPHPVELISRKSQLILLVLLNHSVRGGLLPPFSTPDLGLMLVIYRKQSASFSSILAQGKLVNQNLDLC